MSMRDLGILARHIIRDFPEYYTFFAETEFPYDNRAPDNRFNRNPLLKLGIGADGLKTGHTEEAGYGLVGSAKQGDRRVIFVITGLPSDKVRAEEAERVVKWAFRQFVQKTVVKANQRIVEAPVFMGEAAQVGLVPSADVSLLIPASVRGELQAEVSYSGPISAPIAAGQKLGELVIHVPDLPDARVDLVAEAPVAAGGFMKRVTTAASVLFERVTGEAPAF